MVASRTVVASRIAVAPSRRARVARLVGLLTAGAAMLGLLGACSVEEAFAFGWPQGGVTQQSQRMFDLWIGSAVAALAVGSSSGA